MSRDFSIIVYSTFLKNFEGQKSFLDGLSGLGARGLRVANEIPGTEVFVNDLNPSALELSKKSAELNNLQSYQISKMDSCQFFNAFSKKGSRGAIVDIDPFGSPAKYIDCGIRATIHKGMLSVSATDLQVLHGLFKDACKKKYHGVPVKTAFSNEISVRLILGLIISVAARLDVEATPVFVETNQHYYRVYLRILNKPDTRDEIGYVVYCRNCGNRHTSHTMISSCSLCSGTTEIAGPLWTGKLFERDFVGQMLQNIPEYVDKKCLKAIQKAHLESDMPACYYTLDEIAERLKSAPIPLEQIITRLQQAGFSASPTLFNPTGFRTDCKIDRIKELFSA
jgi:tRNA (guanine26-N2/guanine27-N2)-dimethyltransferase